MRVIVIVVFVLAAIVMLLGVVNHSRAVDVGYGFGTWHDVSLVVVACVVAGLALVVGLASAAGAAAVAAGDRRKLEAELESTYTRLRAAEAAAALPAAETAAAALPAGETGADTAGLATDIGPGGVGVAADAEAVEKAALEGDDEVASAPAEQPPAARGSGDAAV